MWRIIISACWIFFVSSPVCADQEVPFLVDQEQSQTEALNIAFDTAIAQEMDDLLGGSLTSSRKSLIMSVLGVERNVLVSGYNEVALDHDHGAEKMLLVRISASALRKRLQELGVLATMHEPRPYVLTLSGVEPSLTKRLGALQELSGLVPQSTAEGQNIPELKLSWAETWMGILFYGESQAYHSAKTLDEVWFTLWKAYFSRSDKVQEQGATALYISISGWLSGHGPMDFDRMLDTWSTEIDQKSLVGVEMDGPGMVATWLIQSRDKGQLLRKLEDTVRAQGLSLEIP